MSDQTEFVDYCTLLQVNPGCEAKMLEKAYRHFAQMYHPDHPETSDVEEFQQVIEAYSILRDAKKRAAYDRTYKTQRDTTFPHFPDGEDFALEEKSAARDGQIHEKILLYLYKRRREHADDPGVVGYYIQKMLGCSDENFEFHIWYLRAKGLVEMTQESRVAIIIEGVDHVIAASREGAMEKLLIAQAKEEKG